VKQDERDIRSAMAAEMSKRTSRWPDLMGQSFCIVQSKLLSSARHSLQSPVTAVEYGTLQNAYDYFNEALFEASLPQVLITLQRHGRARGYFSAKKFQRRDNTREQVHEVALNPDSFKGRSDEEILSTLVHEMAHVWQQEHGHPGRGRYHNREWAVLMHSIGLMPSTTGKPGGAITGDRVSHYILERGRFSDACGTFLKTYRLVWESASTVNSDSDPAGAAVKTQTRSKFTCPNCGLNAWAKPDALLDCHRCSRECGELVLMGTNGDQYGNDVSATGNKA
jgi:hypothetical protein